MTILCQLLNHRFQHHSRRSRAGRVVLVEENEVHVGWVRRQGTGGRGQEAGVRRNGLGLRIMLPNILQTSRFRSVRNSCCSTVM